MAVAMRERRNPLTLRREEPVALASAPLERGGQTLLAYTQIRTDGGTQMRAGLNETTAGEYAEELRRGALFPPAVVFHDGTDYWLGDGFHRVHAYFLAFGATVEIPCEVRPGTRREAVLCAAGANAVHGLRRTNADKRRAVETLLRDGEWGQWSDREIGRRCHVSHNFVSELRHALQATAERNVTPAPGPGSLSSDDSEPGQQRTYVTRHGTVATMKVAGQRQAGQARQAAKADAQSSTVGDATRATANQGGWMESVQPTVANPEPMEGSIAREGGEGMKQMEQATVHTSERTGEGGRANRHLVLTPAHTLTPVVLTRAQRVAALLALYRDVLNTVEEYAELTGGYTHVPALQRALAPMIEELKGQQGKR